MADVARNALFAAAVLAMPVAAFAFDAEPRMPGRTGIGLGGGTRATGLSIKHALGDVLALQGVVGIDSTRYAEDDDEVLAISLDVLFEQAPIVGNSDVELAWAIGAGPYLGIGGDFWLGATFVAGLELNLKVIPLDFVLEYRPTFELVGPDAGIEVVEFGGHLRWWF
jgi:hypothetical protein